MKKIYRLDNINDMDKKNENIHCLFRIYLRF